METYNLLLKNLLSKDLTKIKTENLSQSLKKEFEIAAEGYIKIGNYKDAIGTFAITKNEDKLIMLGRICLNENRVYEAFQAFYYANDKKNLNEVGESFLKMPDIKLALEAFRKSENNEMVKFFETNLIN